MHRTLAFLGIDPNFQPEGLYRMVNFQKRVLSPVPAAARQQLISLFASDVEKTAELFSDDIDLTLWPEFLE